MISVLFCGNQPQCEMKVLYVSLFVPTHFCGGGGGGGGGETIYSNGFFCSDNFCRSIY